MRNFYHGKDATIVSGSANFAAIIAAEFAALGLTTAQSTAFGLVNTSLQTSYSEATTPATRTSVAIEQKNLAMPLRLGGDVHGIVGATLSARATTEGVRRALALYQVVVNHKE